MSNHDVINGLQPAAVWKHFADLSSIPRRSKHEEKAASHVLNVAAHLGLAATRDAAGNVIVRKPAARGREDAPSVCLQGHLDMVCVKDQAKTHDFSTDPIMLIHRDGFIAADGTTLGADNGIAVATNLALMEADDLAHGPIEFLFTVDEETGLNGAKRLEPGFVRSRLLLNLDSEEEGELYIGCAGGCDTVAKWPVQHEPAPPDAIAIEVAVAGLRGGHSGADIDKGRGNAIKILNRVVLRLLEQGGRLARIDGGTARNAIPDRATAVLFISASVVEECLRVVARMRDIVTLEIGGVENALAIDVKVLQEKPSHTTLSADLQRHITTVISALPHGIVRMSQEIPGLVETSTNVATVETGREFITLATSQRSSVMSALDEMADSVRTIFTLAAGSVEQTDAYPGWKPNLHSPILEIAQVTYRELFGARPSVKAIHAGLECGVIGARYPGIDMLSFGPTITDVHSIDERIDVASVLRFWQFITALLGAIH
jgi:dipeptidase D